MQVRWRLIEDSGSSISTPFYIILMFWLAVVLPALGRALQLGQRIAQRLARHAKDAVKWPIQIHDNVDRGRDRQCSEGDRDIGQEITWSAQPKAGENHRQPEH